MLLTKAQILAAEDLPSVDVHVTQWGGTVRVRVLTATERDELDKIVLTDDSAVKQYRATMLAFCIVDENNKRLFETTDITALGEKSAAACDSIFAAASKLNNLDEDVKKN